MSTKGSIEKLMDAADACAALSMKMASSHGGAESGRDAGELLASATQAIALARSFAHDNDEAGRRIHERLYGESLADHTGAPPPSYNTSDPDV